MRFPFLLAVAWLLQGCAAAPPREPSFPAIDPAVLAELDRATATRAARESAERAEVAAEEKRVKDAEELVRAERARALHEEHVLQLEAFRRREEKGVEIKRRAAEVWASFDRLPTKKRTVTTLDAALSESYAGSGEMNDDDAEALRLVNLAAYRSRRVAMLFPRATVGPDAGTVVPASDLGECERLGARWAADEASCTKLEAIGVVQISCPRFRGVPREWSIRDQLAAFAAARDRALSKEVATERRPSPRQPTAVDVPGGVPDGVVSGGSPAAVSDDDPAKTVHVRGYTKKNGTYVAPHTRHPARR